MKPIVTMTDKAAERIRTLHASRSADVLPRLSVKHKGCTGLTYSLDFAKTRDRFDEVVTDKGITLLVDGSAFVFIVGTEIDYEETLLKSGFIFRNPLEKGRCGCGESFHT